MSMTLGLYLHFLSDYIFILLMYNFISILSYPHYTYSDVYLHHLLNSHQYLLQFYVELSQQTMQIKDNSNIRDRYQKAKDLKIGDIILL